MVMNDEFLSLRCRRFLYAEIYECYSYQIRNNLLCRTVDGNIIDNLLSSIEKYSSQPWCHYFPHRQYFIPRRTFQCLKFGVAS